MKDEKQAIPFFLKIDPTLTPDGKLKLHHLFDLVGQPTMHSGEDTVFINMLFKIGDYWYVRCVSNSPNKLYEISNLVLDFLSHVDTGYTINTAKPLFFFLESLTKEKKKYWPREVYFYNHHHYGDKLPGVVAKIALREGIVDKEYSLLQQVHNGKLKFNSKAFKPIHYDGYSNPNIEEAVKLNHWFENIHQLNRMFKPLPKEVLKRLISIPRVRYADKAEIQHIYGAYDRKVNSKSQTPK